MPLLAILGAKMDAFGSLFSLKNRSKNHIFSRRPQNDFLRLLCDFRPIFDEFWDAESTSKGDRRHDRKTLKTIVGVIKIKGFRMSETIKNVSGNLKNTHACRTDCFVIFCVCFYNFSYFGSLRSSNINLNIAS
jgi:hypothetical protein